MVEGPPGGVLWRNDILCDIRITLVGATLTPALQEHVKAQLTPVLTLLSEVTQVSVDLRQPAVPGVGQKVPYRATVEVMTQTVTHRAVVRHPGLYTVVEVAAKQLMDSLCSESTPKHHPVFPGDSTRLKLEVMLAS